MFLYFGVLCHIISLVCVWGGGGGVGVGVGVGGVGWGVGGCLLDNAHNKEYKDFSAYHTLIQVHDTVLWAYNRLYRMVIKR